MPTGTSAGPPRVPEREEGMRGRVHLPWLRLSRPAHTPPDPGAGPGPDLQAADVHDQIERGCVFRCIRPRLLFLQVLVKTEAGKERTVCPDLDAAVIQHLVGDEDRFERGLRCRIGRDAERVVHNRSAGCNGIGKGPDLVRRDVVPEPRVIRVEVPPARAIASASSSSFGGFMPGPSSSCHHSEQYPAGTSGWLFSRNSPYEMRISPTSRIFSIFAFSRFAVASSSIRSTSPFFSRTVGPSMESTGTTPQALPGRSVFIWVPVARNSPRT